MMQALFNRLLVGDQIKAVGVRKIYTITEVMYPGAYRLGKGQGLATIAENWTLVNVDPVKKD